MRLRILADLFRQKYVCKTLKYTKYSCGFTPFSDEKSLVRLSCRFVRYCPKKPPVQADGRFLTLFRNMLHTLGEDGFHMTVCQRVENGFSLSAAFYQPALL